MLRERDKKRGRSSQRTHWEEPSLFVLPTLGKRQDRSSGWRESRYSTCLTNSRKSVLGDALPRNCILIYYDLVLSKYAAGNEEGIGPHSDSGDLGNLFPDHLEVSKWSQLDPCSPAYTSHRSTGLSLSVQRLGFSFGSLHPTSVKGLLPPFGGSGASAQRPFCLKIFLRVRT